MKINKNFLNLQLETANGLETARKVACVLYAANRRESGITNTVHYQVACLFGDKALDIDHIKKKTGFKTETIRWALSDICNDVFA